MSWYYVANGQQAGPVEDAEVEALVAGGAITPQTLVWRPGMENWLPFANVAGVRAATEKCLQCGRLYPPEETIPIAGGRFCGGCKPLVLQRFREGHSIATSGKRFAGFWIRFVARMIDGTITSIAGYIFQIPMFMVIFISGARGEPPIGLIIASGAFAILGSLAAAAYYEAWFLVKKGSTPGKMILGLKVVRARGGGISWGLGFGRYLAHTLSGLTLYIGYLMAAWDEEKRALHDRICDTRVVHGG